MRLINTSTLELSEFNDSEIPKYAILSHTWSRSNEEVSYQDWCARAFPNKAGYEKIYRFCQICGADGFGWAWVDTCCIDKTSSAELSEAINSMYRWYTNKVCYAYLDDVPNSDNIEAEGSAFCLSRWFTRGWTLQELIAPRTVYFYSKDWTKIAQKRDHSEVVARITGIPRKLLTEPKYLRLFSVAQKMSWASKRETSRIEDIAYCLLGLFDINMPLLYGEGGKAFPRLQEEIMKISADHTLFAWTTPNENFIHCGLLAPSPKYFAGSSRFVRQEINADRIPKPYSVTNRGLEIELSLCPPRVPGESRLAILGCVHEDFPSKSIAVYLSPRGDSLSSSYKRAMLPEGDLARTSCHKLEFLDGNDLAPSPQIFYIYRGGPTFLRDYLRSIRLTLSDLGI